MIQAGLPIAKLRQLRQDRPRVRVRDKVGNSLVVRDSGRRGRRDHAVELPAHQIRAQGRARARRGCTVVLKPSEIAPFNAFILAEVVHEVGLPGGRVSTWSPGSVRWSARRWSSIPRST